MISMILSLYVIVLFIFSISNGQDDISDARLEKKEDESAEISHQVDSLNLLIFVSLLIATVLTIWLFKRVRLRFVHETGLSIIYGLIVGAIIKYSSNPLPSPNSQEVQIIPLKDLNFSIPPDYLKLNIVSHHSNETFPLPRYYQYSLTSQVERDAKIKPELEEKATFDPEVFFNVLLPPIIFNAGYSMKRKHFFKNFGAISTYAFLGTLISSFIISFIMYGFLMLTGSHWAFNDCLKFGAIISATDPVSVLAIFNDLNVDVDLYALVFGESILNDAVAIVLVSTVDAYKSEKTGFDGIAVIQSIGNFFVVFLGAFALGCGMGCVTAFMTKFTHVRDYPLLETSLFVLMSYCTFLAAEAAQLTGIVAVLFCGICQAHYTYNNLSTESKARTKQIFELFNFLTENFVFVYIGVSTFTFNKHIWNFPFILMSFLAIIVARACNIYPLSFFVNLGRNFKIPFSFQHFMMFSGLRGAMAFALAIRDTSSANECTMFTATLSIVMTTIILSGGCTTQLLTWLKIRVGIVESREAQAFEALHNRQSHQSTNNKRSLLGLWYRWDYRFMKPLLTHARPPLMETMPRCCLPFSRAFTSEQQKQQVSIAGNERADDDSDFEFALVGEQELNYEDALLHSTSVFNNPRSDCGTSVADDRTNGGQPQLSLQVRLPGQSGDAV